LAKGLSLAVTNLKYIVGKKSILDIDKLSVNSGEIVAVMGANGAGKTSLFRILGLIQKPSAGDIFIGGKLINNTKKAFEARQEITMLFQAPVLLNSYSVYDNVAYPLKIRGYNKDRIMEIIWPLLEHFRIDNLAKEKAWSVSGGEARRITLARALSFEPKILLLDEPFTFIDEWDKRQITKSFFSLARKKEVTVLFVTHQKEEAISMADRLLFINRGKIIQQDSPHMVINKPKTEFIANFLDSIALLEGKTIKSDNGLTKISVNGCFLYSTDKQNDNTEVSMMLKPQDVILGKQALKSSARNSVKGKVVKITDKSSYVEVNLDCGFNLAAHISRAALEELCIKEGEDIVAGFKAGAVHLIPKGND